MDTLRNWERNGLLCVKRKQNGYRVYTGEDIDRLIISLQTAEQKAAIMTDMLMDMKRKFPNPPL